jgi:hypothetical protein
VLIVAAATVAGVLLLTAYVVRRAEAQPTDQDITALRSQVARLEKDRDDDRHRLQALEERVAALEAPSPPSNVEAPVAPPAAAPAQPAKPGVSYLVRYDRWTDRTAIDATVTGLVPLSGATPPNAPTSLVFRYEFIGKREALAKGDAPMSHDFVPGSRNAAAPVFHGNPDLILDGRASGWSQEPHDGVIAVHLLRTLGKAKASVEGRMGAFEFRFAPEAVAGLRALAALLPAR